MTGRFLALLLCASALLAQDERRVASPNGQIEFHLFIAASQNETALPRLAYQVFFRGKRIVDTSYLGFDIFDQEPLLGENDGLTSSSLSSGPGYNALRANYMQNGSLGRLLVIEARVYDQGVAFRYTIPPSTPLMDLLIADEATEFHFAGNASMSSPFQVDGVWVAIGQSSEKNFPPMHLALLDKSTLITRLDRHGNSAIAYEGHTPFTSPWRTISIGADRSAVMPIAPTK